MTSACSHKPTFAGALDAQNEAIVPKVGRDRPVGLGVTNLKTTVAVRSKDATKATRKAKKVIKSFRPAGQAD